MPLLLYSEIIKNSLHAILRYGGPPGAKNYILLRREGLLRAPRMMAQNRFSETGILNEREYKPD